MVSGQKPEWIGVEQVAQEMQLTPRAAWELIKRIQVHKTDDRMALARFRRSDFEAARDSAMRAAPPRASRPSPASARPVTTPIPESKAAQNLAKLARLKR